MVGRKAFAGFAGMVFQMMALVMPASAELEQARASEEARGREGSGETYTDVDEFRINAQYRGAIKKSFKDVGEGRIEYTTTAKDTFRIRVTGLIENPDSGEKYDLDLDMSFALDGGKVEVTENRNRFDESTEWSRKRIERTLPFLYLVRAHTPDGRRGGSRDYMYKGREVTIRYGHTERNLEASVYEREELIGKVFLKRGGNGPLTAMEKFRVPAQDDVMVSFIVND